MRPMRQRGAPRPPEPFLGTAEARSRGGRTSAKRSYLRKSRARTRESRRIDDAPIPTVDNWPLVSRARPVSAAVDTAQVCALAAGRRLTSVRPQCLLGCTAPGAVGVLAPTGRPDWIPTSDANLT